MKSFQSILSNQFGFCFLISTLILLSCDGLEETQSVVNPKADLPRRGDVCMSSRFVRPISDSDPYNTLAYLDSFGANRLEWIYTRDSVFIRKAHEKGIKVFSTLNTILPDSFGAQSTRIGRMINLEGDTLTAPWMRKWRKGIANWGCLNHPLFKEIFFEAARASLDAGADGLQIDDPMFNLKAIEWGGCFCEYCVEGFRKYLTGNYSEKEIKSMGVESVESFNVREYMVSKSYSSKETSYLRKEAISNSFVRFQEQSVKHFYEEFRAAMNIHYGSFVTLSSNNYAGTWDFPYSMFDYGVAELPSEKTNPAYIYDKISEASVSGKMQVFSLMDTSTFLNRKTLAFTYACGGLLCAPWDINIKLSDRNSERWFGKPADYIDLYSFIKSNRQFFDDYEEVEVANLKQKRNSSDMKISGPTETGNVYAIMRENKLNAGLPSVIHIVNWNSENMDGLNIHISKSRLPADLEFHFLQPGKASKRIVPVSTNSNMLKIVVPELKEWGLIICGKVKG